jgi:hypothetical protein
VVVQVEGLALEQITKQLNKLVNVIKIVELEPEQAVQRDHFLIKVKTDAATRSQVLEAVDLFALLNRYFDGLAQAVIAEQGLLDKFIGDSLMAEFGLPRSRGEAAEALAAVRAAQAMQLSLERLNQELELAGQPPLRHGIGIHVGEVVAGNRLNWRALLVAEQTADVTATIETFSRIVPLQDHEKARIERDIRRNRRFVHVLARIGRGRSVGPLAGAGPTGAGQAVDQSVLAHPGVPPIAQKLLRLNPLTKLVHP